MREKLPLLLLGAAGQCSFLEQYELDGRDDKDAADLVRLELLDVVESVWYALSCLTLLSRRMTKSKARRLLVILHGQLWLSAEVPDRAYDDEDALDIALLRCWGMMRFTGEHPLFKELRHAV